MFSFSECGFAWSTLSQCLFKQLSPLAPMFIDPARCEKCKLIIMENARSAPA